MDEQGYHYKLWIRRERFKEFRKHFNLVFKGETNGLLEGAVYNPGYISCIKSHFPVAEFREVKRESGLDFGALMVNKQVFQKDIAFMPEEREYDFNWKLHPNSGFRVVKLVGAETDINKQVFDTYDSLLQGVPLEQLTDEQRTLVLIRNVNGIARYLGKHVTLPVHA